MNNVTNINTKRKQRRPRGVPSCMDVPEVAYELGLSEWKVYDMLRKKELSGFRVGNRWIIPREDFIQWMDNKRRKAR